MNRKFMREAIRLSAGQRARINAIYKSYLPQDICLDDPYQSWRFNVRVPRKEAALQAVFAAGLFASSHYASLVGILGTDPTSFLLSSTAARQRTAD